ncbi:hypothetical protein LSTR_LSTR003583 [Laodelphax striatellus]|uniref:Xaa-Pro aminopeptidase 1 n=1 Tax=Laodelphax striatellus TaxID=195883 RepID=A0A482WL04_LAOST|nr:hypothetical protein LSTR_LSTR003583 [Laodelphax striatellus]
MEIRKTGILLKKLRDLLKNVTYVKESLHAYIVPHNDGHLNEYISARDERLAFISGFTGSFGTAIITENNALLWTDGRYTLQARGQMDENWNLFTEGLADSPSQSGWLVKNLPVGARVGCDPHLLSYTMWTTIAIQLNDAGLHLVPVDDNLIDVIWQDQPAPSSSVVNPLPVKYTGKFSKLKVEEVRSTMAEKKAEVLIVTALDEITWLFNLRGSDIEYNPVFFAYAAVTLSYVHLFIDESKLSPAVKGHFKEEGLNVTIHPYDQINKFISDQVSRIEASSNKVWVSHSSPFSQIMIVPEKMRLLDVSPIALLKAIKNETEAQGFINCHIRDAVALICYLAWLEKELAKGSIVTELSGAAKLLEFRKEQDEFVGPSFETISSAGPNAAIIHYSPTVESDRRITTDEIYLCDSGGQYKDGTTDVTRTLHFGTPSQFEKECFTRVYKGQIAIATSVFPRKIKGMLLDPRARKALWDIGLDYNHGTGHGVGSYLCVHEGPMGISWRVYPDDPGLQEGMFLSNEPGYYENGKFGIRLEDIIRVVPAQTPHNFSDKGFLKFETITFVPIQTKMLLPELLTEEEIAYLNNYHNMCGEKIAPILIRMGKTEAFEWLSRETQPLGQCQT